MPERMFYMTRAQQAMLNAAGAGGGLGAGIGLAIGGAIVKSIAGDEPTREEMTAKVEERHLDMGAILVEEMRKALAQQKDVRVVDRPEDATYVVSLKIKKYGFEGGPVVLGMDMSFGSKGGVELFSDSVEKTDGNNSRHALAQYAQDPASIDPVFRSVAAKAAAAEMGDVSYRLGQLSLIEPAQQ
jgi:hypothetical protein